MYNGKLSTNCVTIVNDYVSDTLKLYKIVYCIHADHNDTIFAVNDYTPTLKSIGVYQITYNILWDLNDNDDCENYLENNRLGILTFCNINGQFIDTSIKHSSGNIFKVNANNTFMYNNTTLNSCIDILLYKNYEQYINDINMDSFSTTITVKFIGS